MPGVKGMRRAMEHNLKISNSLKGKKKSKDHRLNQSRSMKILYSDPTRNPNYKGENVGYIGIHIWLRKVYGLADKCEKCGIIGEKKNGKWTIVWALKKGFRYERKRANFIKLCNKCHRLYDITPTWNKHISESKTLITL